MASRFDMASDWSALPPVLSCVLAATSIVSCSPEKSDENASPVQTSTKPVALEETTKKASCDLELVRNVSAKCSVCHSLKPSEHLAGPSLGGLIGRKSGSVEGFAFSTAMTDANITWSEETLDKFLQDPQAMVPGTTMPFSGLKEPTQRDAIACWVRNGQVSDK